MIKVMSLMLVAATLVACSSIEVSNLDKKNASEHSGMIKKIEQNNQQENARLEELKRDIVLYRQDMLKIISDADIKNKISEFSKYGPAVEDATAEDTKIKQEAMDIQQKKLNNTTALLNSYVSDSLITNRTKMYTISYQEQLDLMESEIAEFRTYVNQLDEKPSIVKASKTVALNDDPVPVVEAKPVEKPAPVAATKPVIKEEKAKPAAAPKSVEAISPEVQLEYDNAKAIYDLGDYDNAVSMFSGFLKKYPKHQLAPNAQYWLGESYYSAQDYQNAIVEFSNVIWNYPDSNKAPDAQFKLGLSYLKQGDDRQAKIELQKVKTNYPNYERMNQVNNYLAGIKK